MKKEIKKQENQSEDKLFAFLATFLTIIGFVIALILRRDNDYVMHYAKQGLVLFIIQVIIWGVSAIPFIGWFFGGALWILFLILWVISWINALSGQKKKTFIVSEFADKIKL